MQESTATANLSELINNLKTIHEKQLREVQLMERIRMLDAVKSLYALEKIDKEAVEILALEIAMGE